MNISSVHAHETTRQRGPVCQLEGRHGGVHARVQRGAARRRRSAINCVAPGAVEHADALEQPQRKSGAEKIQGAIGKPEDIAAAICFLAAAEARFITGTTLVVDGGRLDIL